MTTPQNSQNVTAREQGLNERGFASIVIALVMILVLALLTIGFAQLARREQQTALDKQLANQAYYAAESGVNDAQQDIVSGAICDGSIKITPACPTATTTDASSTTCMTPAGSPLGGTGAGGSVAPLPATALTANPNLSQQNGDSYSCLLVNLSPDKVKWPDTPPNTGQYLNFSTTASLNSVTIQWSSHDGQNTFVPGSSTFSPGQFPSLNTWKKGSYPPVVQFSITPTTTLSRSSLISQTFNVYLYPANDTNITDDTGKQTAGTVAANSTQVAEDLTDQGQIVSGDCGKDATNPTACSVTITGLPGGQSYSVHFISYYDTASVNMGGSTCPGGVCTPVKFIGQAQIDVTGKAHNVLKRLQAQLQITYKHDGTVTGAGNQPTLPDEPLEAQNICKRFQTLPSAVDHTHFIGPSSNADIVDGENDPCNLNQ